MDQDGFCFSVSGGEGGFCCFVSGGEGGFCFSVIGGEGRVLLFRYRWISKFSP